MVLDSDSIHGYAKYLNQQLKKDGFCRRDLEVNDLEDIASDYLEELKEEMLQCFETSLPNS